MQTFLNLPKFKNDHSAIYARELQLSYKRSVQLWEPVRYQVNSSNKVHELLRSIWDEDQIAIKESFYLLCFSTKLELLGFYRVSEGGLDSVMVDFRLLFATALLAKASSIVVAHNHPSGTLSPSAADKQLTIRLENAAELLNITLNDHLILTEKSYYSFRDEGLL
ncbi:JAB domain-containing protein [Sphingobacterium deserti]|nr:JAB domain-containing protein [Sphingobacterium deserti]